MALREAVLSKCFEDFRGREVTFAGGQKANNKLELEKIKNSPILRSEVVYQIVRLIDEGLDSITPDLVIPVPEGANWLGFDVAKKIGCRTLLLDKDKETREISLRAGGEAAVAGADSIVIVEDVLNRLTSSEKVYNLPGVGERTDLVAGIWDRNPLRRHWLPVPVEAVFVENIPAELPDESPLWDYAV